MLQETLNGQLRGLPSQFLTRISKLILKTQGLRNSCGKELTLTYYSIRKQFLLIYLPFTHKICLCFSCSSVFLAYLRKYVVLYVLFLQFVKVVHLTEVYLFHDMIDMLIGCGYKKGTTLFGYGYDFRQSIRFFTFNC